MSLLFPTAPGPARFLGVAFTALLILLGVGAAAPGTGTGRDLVRYRVVPPVAAGEPVTCTFQTARTLEPVAVVGVLPGRDLRAFGHERLVQAFRQGTALPLARTSAGWRLDLRVPPAEEPSTILVWFVGLEAGGRTLVAPALPLIVVPGGSPPPNPTGAAANAAGGGAAPGAKPHGGGNGVPAASAGRSAGTLSLRALASDASITIHDQPTPVQGSGH